MTEHPPKRSLRDLVSRDGIAPVWCDGHEVLRRIFVTVRDKNWQEVPPAQWESEIDQAQRTATLTARHISDSVAFEWKGVLRVSDGLRSLRFQITGQVLQDMEVCRLGLVVLHPVESMVGSQLAAIGPRTDQRLTVSGILAPQPIVNAVPQAMTEPFAKLLVERADFGRLELQFEGDLFELEDQRNWGDASFKTYCTPLRLGFPRALKAGTSIVHSVEVRFRPGTGSKTIPAQAGAATRSGGTPSDVPVNTNRGWGASDRSASGVFPRIGREWRHSSSAVCQVSGHEPPWSHLHFEAEGPESVTALRALLESATCPKVEIGMETVGDGPSSEVLTLLSVYREHIARLLLYGSRTSLPSAALVERWRRQLEATGAQQPIPVLAATRGYFVEFNREVAFDAAVSGIAFPLTATVHSDDAETISDNVPTIRDMADTARNHLGFAEVAVAPLALYYPRKISQKFPTELIAPWLAATLINTALARVASVTLAVDVLESIGANMPHAPTFISRLVECGGFEVVPLEGKLPSRLHAVVFTPVGSNRSCVLVANLNPQSATISLPKVELRARTVTNAMTGASAELNTEQVAIPGFGVTWIG